MSRLLNAALALVGLLVLSPVLLLVAVAVKLDSPGPVFFKHDRVGLRFKPIGVRKFRTMKWPPGGPELTTSGDSRVTRVGRFLRRAKVDELPQLINVVVGDMNLVGPRPEARRFVEMFRADYEEILTVRPGITGIASLKYRNESALLDTASDAEAFYVERILPDKIKLDKDYVRDRSFLLDIRLLVRTANLLISGSKP